MASECRNCVKKISKLQNPKRAIRTKELRHLRGINKRYNSIYTKNALSSTEEYQKQYRKKNGERIRLNRKKYKYSRKNAGKLSKKTIQLVYEDNIKKYGTLTCIYCLRPILFGNDTLEHKQPLSRGGTNEYTNLAIACWKCNSKKRNKTELEYRKRG